MVFKLIFGKQIHLTGSQDKPELSQLRSFIGSHFKTLPPKYALTYIDEEGDEITLNDQNDYAILLGNKTKTTKVILREVNEDFVDATAKLTIHELEEPEQKEEMVEPGRQEMVAESQQEESRISEVDESLIEEKLKRMMPEIISQVKSQVSEEMEQSRLGSTQPVIEEEKAEPRKMEEPAEPKKMEEPVAEPFMKIQTLQESPLKITTTLDFSGDHSRIEYDGRQLPLPSGCEVFAQYGLTMLRNFLERQSRPAEPAQQERQEQPRQNCHDFWKQVREMKQKWWQAQMQGQNAEHWQKMKEEWARKKAEWGCQGRKWGRGWGGCPYKWNKCQEKPEEKPEQKEECHKMKEEPVAREEEQIPEAEVSYEEIIDRANYLVQVFGYDFPKCMKWAQEYAQLTTEELLNFCLEDRTFHQ